MAVLGAARPGSLSRIRGHETPGNRTPYSRQASLEYVLENGRAERSTAWPLPVGGESPRAPGMRRIVTVDDRSTPVNRVPQDFVLGGPLTTPPGQPYPPMTRCGYGDAVAASMPRSVGGGRIGGGGGAAAGHPTDAGGPEMRPDLG
jgi:hypothetical protein